MSTGINTTQTRQVEGLTLGKRLHRSRHADTFLADYHGLPVVIKRVRDDLTLSHELIKAQRSIRAEGMLLKAVEAPGIVRVVEVIHTPATLILELLDGRSIREEMRIRRRIPDAEVASVGAQIAAALDHLHARGLLHRDVKPANVMYHEGRATLIDFHLAEEIGDMQGGAGTRLFAAPEQVVGGKVTGAADVWGLGTVLYRAFTSRLPFFAESGHPQLTSRPTPALQQLADARFEGDCERATRTHSKDLAQLIDTMLSADPLRRPTAAECRELFTAYKKGAES